MAKATPPATATSSRGDTLCLNGSNHPDIGPEGLVLRGGRTESIPNPTPSLLDYLRGFPGVVVTLPSTDPLN